MQPDNGLIGDISATELPEKPVDNDAINEIRKKAKYSRSKEFQELKENMMQRIEFYTKYLPNGTPVATLSQTDASRNWPLANIIIAELQQVIDGYANAEEESKRIEEQLK